LLEAFTGLPQHLWICTRLNPSFAKLYSNELNNLPNTHLLGWVQPRSSTYYQIMHRCAFCILPSCSEGQSQSVVDAMNQGLIPLVSRQVGLDVQDFGFFIESPAVDSIRSLVESVSVYSPARCQELSRLARQAAQTDDSQEAFMRNFQNALQELLY
jgi:glycosyltransferase involved in cell wall biosynthesis